MYINKQKRIDVNRDSIISAIHKKANNKALSRTTLNKLVKIANSTVGLTKAEAKDVFINNKPIEKNVYSATLAFNLKKSLSQISSAVVKNNIESFIRNSNSTLLIHTGKRMSTQAIGPIKRMNSREFVESHANRIGQTIGQGSEAIVVEDNENNHNVLKIFFDDVKNDEIVNQASSFRKFYGENSASIISGRAILMKKVNGRPLSEIKKFPPDSMDNFKSLLEEMVKKGCVPSDMSENNFLYNKVDNTFSPIDITTTTGRKVNENGLKYIINYINNKTID